MKVNEIHKYIILTNLKHSKNYFTIYVIIMKTISVFFLIFYWSIMISAPIMSEDDKLSRLNSNKSKLANTKVIE